MVFLWFSNGFPHPSDQPQAERAAYAAAKDRATRTSVKMATEALRFARAGWAMLAMLWEIISVLWPKIIIMIQVSERIIL